MLKQVKEEEESPSELLHTATPMPTKFMRKQYSSSDSIGFREDPFGLLLHKKNDALDKKQFQEMKLNKNRLKVLQLQDDLKPTTKLKFNPG